MIDFLASLNIYVLGLLAGLMTWGVTALGAATVYLIREFKQVTLDIMLGFAAGVMIAASFFSLIIPGLEYAKDYNPGLNPVVVIASGFVVGALFLLLLDKITPHLHIFEKYAEGPNTGFKRSTLMVLAITLHNIPEGLAVGVAIGAFGITQDVSMLISAIALTVGIALQNFPEGAAISLPLLGDRGISKHKAFMLGQASALVEPVGILIGIALTQVIQVVLPFALAFAAGAMMFVVIEELIPESQKNNNTDVATLATIFGLVIMMSLDVLLG